jgi:hypothetical protein
MTVRELFHARQGFSEGKNSQSIHFSEKKDVRHIFLAVDRGNGAQTAVGDRSLIGMAHRRSREILLLFE